MPNCASYNCQVLGTWENTNDLCKTSRSGGFSHMILFECDATTVNFTAAEINADIAAGLAHVLEGRGGMSLPTPIETESRLACGPLTQVTNNSHTITFQSGIITIENNNFISTLISGHNIGAAVLMECDSEGWDDIATVIDPSGGLRFSGGRIVPDRQGEGDDHFELTGTFLHNGLPEIIAKPLGITGIDA